MRLLVKQRVWHVLPGTALAMLAVAGLVQASDRHRLYNSQHLRDSDFNNQLISCFQSGVEVIRIASARNITLSYEDGQLIRVAYYIPDSPFTEQFFAVAPSLACNIQRE